MLIDSNIIIYAIRPEFTKLRDMISEYNPAVSAISYLEVLGYHRLSIQDKQDFTDFFGNSYIIPVSQLVLEQAVELRQQRKISLGDSIIAATVLINNLTLITANTGDFQWIQGLKLLNPLTE